MSSHTRQSIRRISSHGTPPSGTKSKRRGAKRVPAVISLCPLCYGFFYFFFAPSGTSISGPTQRSTSSGVREQRISHLRGMFASSPGDSRR